LRLNYLTRIWFYFRIGYSTYLTFLLGYLSTLVTVYYLAIKNIPSLLDLFPRFVPFAALATIIGVPAAVGIGWMHYKRSSAFESELDIQVEANPYYFKAPPGKEKDAYVPLYLELLSLLKRLLDNEGLLEADDKLRIKSLETKLQTLMEGGMVGTPRRKL
jgi:hypothetical protein